MSKLQELEQQLQNLQSEIEKLKQAEQNGNQWVPIDGDFNYFLSNRGNIGKSVWIGIDSDKDRLSIGNVFPTKEEAEFEVEKLKVIAELKKFSKDYEEGKDNYCIYYNLGYDYISYDYEWTVKRTTLYFPSEETARQAVAAVGEDRVKKYYLGVE